jgi:hypothetical protein
VRDEEWEFIASSLARLPEDALQRRDDRRTVFTAARGIARDRARRCALSPVATRVPPWPHVSQRMRRWVAAGGGASVHDLRLRLGLCVPNGREPLSWRHCNYA